MTRLVLALAFLVALTAPAAAGGDVGVVVSGGDGSTQLTAQLETWLSQHGHIVVPTPLPPEAVSALIDCLAIDNRACARDVVETRAKSSIVLYTRIDLKGQRDMTLTAYWFDKGRDATLASKPCPRCTDQALRATADDVMKKLVGGDTGHIKLSSNPAGATISIDGFAIGVTPLDWDLPPGKHTVRMDKAGLRSATRDIVVSAGKIDAVGMVLLPPGSEPDGDSVSGESPSRLLPIAMLAAGGALIVTGGIMIAIDEDPGPHAPATIHNTGPTGIGLAIGGVVVGAVGSYLMWFRSPKPSSAPVAAFSSDSAYVGWLGRF